MTWTYDPALLDDVASGTLMRIRLELSDKDPTEQLLQDEEIAYVIEVESNFWNQCARAAEMIARLFARQADSVQTTVVKLSFKKRVEMYEKMAELLRKRASGQNAPRAPSISQSSKAAYLQNTDGTGPYFRRGMMDRLSQEGGSPAAPYLPPG